MATTIPNPKRLYRPRRKIWTRAEYERMTALGVFSPDDRLELIEGEIVYKMPQNSPHVTGINLTAKTLRSLLTEQMHIRIQAPMALGNRSEPEPDVAVVAGTERDYEESHPTTALLIVEVSDSTLRTDRTTKAGLYARAGIAEYWILNLVERVLEVHRQPARMPGYPLGYFYQQVTRYEESERVSLLIIPGAQITVSDLLPRAHTP